MIKASGLTVNATYDPRLPVADWTASVNKPLSLSLTTVNGRKGGQKIYLTRVTVTITARDDTGPLDSPRPLVDTANISPGFIVTFPYTYGQDFVVPSLDEGATSVTLDFTYEFLLQVSKDSRDYYKQTAIDTLVVRSGADPQGRALGSVARRLSRGGDRRVRPGPEHGTGLGGVPGAPGRGGVDDG